MYSWFWRVLPGPWRVLPGPWPVKTLIVALVLAGLFLLLMQVVFPWLSAQMPYSDVAV